MLCLLLLRSNALPHCNSAPTLGGAGERSETERASPKSDARSGTVSKFFRRWELNLPFLRLYSRNAGRRLNKLLRNDAISMQF